MQYTIEDVSPVRKKVVVTVPVDEVEASLSATIALYRSTVSFDGFRKGKVPSSMIEKRFRDEIYQEATTELVNVHINRIVGETKLHPISRIDYDGKQLERGEEFSYAFSFDVMPEFEIPSYDGFAVEQEETVVNEEEVDSVIERLRTNLAEIITVGDPRLPKAGDIAVIDFAAVNENGEPIPGIQADNFQLPLGEGQTLPDFEALICSLKPGDSTEGPVAFPDDFFNPEFAGKTVTMKVALHGIKERNLPELDEAFAQKAGGFESMEKLRDSVRQSYMKSREDLHKAAAQTTLLESLLKLTDFPLPDTMVKQNLEILLDDAVNKFERQGKSLASADQTEEGLREKLLPEAENRTRAQVFLMAVAKQNALAVTEQEVDSQLRRIAVQNGQDYSAVREYYTQHNLLFPLRDRLLADKAMEAVYEKAAVTIVPPKKDEPAKDEPAAEE